MLIVLLAELLRYVNVNNLEVLDAQLEGQTLRSS